MEKHYGNTRNFLGLRRNDLRVIILVILFTVIGNNRHVVSNSLNWGFYGHKLINKLAVYLLPQPMLPFFLEHINYISDHAIDPDKRRYASEFEGIRHYMDLEYWMNEMDSIPRQWNKMISQNIVFIGIVEQDSIPILYRDGDLLYIHNHQSYGFNDSFDLFIQEQISPNIFKGEYSIEIKDLPVYIQEKIGDFDEIVWRVKLIEHGILPYNLISFHHKLTKAFEEKDEDKILRYASDLGHYIGDAHVPLHTTANYNGQLTNQLGIHAFWETRIPELFAESEFDLFNPKAIYIEDPLNWYWDIVLKSNALVDQVLNVEKSISLTTPSNSQYILTKRNEILQRTETKEYAHLYEQEMGNMVESQMRKAIFAISCAWMTAWVDAGQPQLDSIITYKTKEELVDTLSKQKSIVKNNRGH